MKTDQATDPAPRKASKSERSLTDAQGREYPVKVLDKELVIRDAVVNRILNKATKLRERIISDKQDIVEELETYLNDIAERNGLKWKGSAELLSFDESKRVEIRYHENIRFGIELQLAKQKIDECLKAWTTDSNVNLKAIITEAFQVDKKGQLAKHRILSLRKFKIKDPTWKEAMELIDKAIQVTSTKQYVGFFVRNESGKLERLLLNFSAI